MSIVGGIREIAEGGPVSGVQLYVVLAGCGVTKNGGDSVNLVSTSYSTGAANSVRTEWLRAGRREKPCLGTNRFTA